MLLGISNVNPPPAPPPVSFLVSWGGDEEEEERFRYLSRPVLYSARVKVLNSVGMRFKSVRAGGGGRRTESRW